MDHNYEAIVRASKGGTMFDIGANHGDYTVIMAGHAKRVYAFEPHPENVEILVKNTDKFGETVQVVPYAVSNKEGQTTMFPCPTNPGGHTISELVGHMTIWGHTTNGAFDVPTLTIDKFVEQERIDDLVAVKIDVEGHEQAVLEGMVETMKRFNLLIALETHHTVDLDAIYKLITDAGYIVTNQDNIVTCLVFDGQYLLKKAQ